MIFQKILWVYSFQHESIINWSIAWKCQAFSRYDLWRYFVNKTTFSNTKTVFPTLMLSYVSLQSIQKLSQKTKQEKIVRLFFYCCLKYIYITPRPFGTGSPVYTCDSVVRVMTYWLVREVCGEWRVLCALTLTNLSRVDLVKLVTFSSCVVISFL